MTAVLISIKPKWCELIANGQKTVEVRKSRPKLETPFKVYIYCTKARKYFFHGGIGDALDDLYRMPSGEVKFGYSGELMCCGKPYNKDNFLNGKVIGEFVCDNITGGFLISPWGDWLQKQTCLTYEEINAYGKNKSLFYWHISDLKIYDEPKELTEFNHTDEYIVNQRKSLVHWEYGIDDECAKPIRNPPQSWCYVEVWE